MACNMVMHDKLLPAYKGFVKQTRNCGSSMLETAVRTKVLQLVEKLERRVSADQSFRKMASEPFAAKGAPTKRLRLRQQEFYEKRIAENLKGCYAERQDLLLLKNTVEARMSHELLHKVESTLKFSDIAPALESS